MGLRRRWRRRRRPSHLKRQLLRHQQRLRLHAYTSPKHRRLRPLQALALRNRHRPGRLIRQRPLERLRRRPQRPTSQRRRLCRLRRRESHQVRQPEPKRLARHPVTSTWSVRPDSPTCPFCPGSLPRTAPVRILAGVDLALYNVCRAPDCAPATTRASTGLGTLLP